MQAVLIMRNSNIHFVVKILLQMRCIKFERIVNDRITAKNKFTLICIVINVSSDCFQTDEIILKAITG